MTYSPVDRLNSIFMINSLHLLHIVLLSISILARANTARSGNGNYITLSFPSFDPSSSNTFFTVFTAASIASNGALQLTPDTLNNIDQLTHKAGRIFLSNPFKLWETDSTKYSGIRLASFSTRFDINIYRTSGSLPGEGFTFLISSSLVGPPLGSEDGYLGLTNSTKNGHLSDRFVAIEFDTIKQSHDPDDNHVGLDINGVNSTVVNSLTPFGIEISPVNATNYTVWINYEGLVRRIWVYMAVQGNPKPANDVLNTSLDLSKVIDKVAFIGFSASTGARYQLNSVLAWELTVEILKKDRTGLSKSEIAIIGASCSTLAVLLLLLSVCYYI
ncbi:Lectin-like protein kinase-like [Rhynchospora pubera]|uniref:Lectin-like protein kinase-like n=1 Tax=Rhynchospora pubera TaxID=906938 RepID=A0AAV8DTC8_9POAL|nr:Lectin-like protein kinase-like [Rhynchospora pubera]